MPSTRSPTTCLDLERASRKQLGPSLPAPPSSSGSTRSAPSRCSGHPRIWPPRRTTRTGSSAATEERCERRLRDTAEGSQRVGSCVAEGEAGRAPAARAGPPRVESLPLDPAHTFERFVIGDGNRLAHAAALAVAELPGEAYNPLFLHGPPGLGKTHLLGAIGDYLRRQRPDLTVHYTTAERFTTEFVGRPSQGRAGAFKQRYRELDALLIDDVQALEGKEHTQEEFVAHVQCASRGGEADRPLERPAARGPRAARGASPRPFPVGPLRRARIPRPSHPNRRSCGAWPSRAPLELPDAERPSGDRQPDGRKRPPSRGRDDPRGRPLLGAWQAGDQALVQALGDRDAAVVDLRSAPPLPQRRRRSRRPSCAVLEVSRADLLSTRRTAAGPGRGSSRCTSPRSDLAFTRPDRP